ncbi:hypothetical protein QMN36_24410, partial [Escherichia coli]|nr:hypothetical protein [Escherichia coli]
ARVNKAGTPVAGGVIFGVFLYLFPPSSNLPKTTQKMGLGFFLSGIFSPVAHLFTLVAVLPVSFIQLPAPPNRQVFVCRLLL